MIKRNQERQNAIYRSVTLFDDCDSNDRLIFTETGDRLGIFVGIVNDNDDSNVHEIFITREQVDFLANLPRIFQIK